MGKVVIIFVVSLSIIIPLILSTNFSLSEEVPETITEEIVHNEVRNIGNFALTYAIKQLRDKSVSVTSGTQSFDYENFNVLQGKVNQIKYITSSDLDTIKITADVETYVNDKVSTHRSVAYVSTNPTTCSPQGVTNAITASGEIEIKGSSEVNGTVEEYADIDFESVFGFTKDQLMNGATHYLEDPENNFSPCDNITWVELSEDNEQKISDNGWYGEGITIIDGDAHVSGGTFVGILWITGNLLVTGNPTIEGAVFAEGGTDIQVTKITGNPIISFNQDAVEQEYSIFMSNSGFQVLSWYE